MFSRTPTGRASKGSVSVINTHDRLQLRFSYGGKCHYLTLGLPDTAANQGDILAFITRSLTVIQAFTDGSTTISTSHCQVNACFINEHQVVWVDSVASNLG